jgi:hypothetical protein
VVKFASHVIISTVKLAGASLIISFLLPFLFLSSIFISSYFKFFNSFLEHCFTLFNPKIEKVLK